MRPQRVQLIRASKCTEQYLEAAEEIEARSSRRWRREPARRRSASSPRRPSRGARRSHRRAPPPRRRITRLRKRGGGAEAVAFNEAWDRAEERERDAVMRHRSLLRRWVNQHKVGVEVRTSTSYSVLLSVSVVSSVGKFVSLPFPSGPSRARVRRACTPARPAADRSRPANPRTTPGSPAPSLSTSPSSRAKSGRCRRPRNPERKNSSTFPLSPPSPCGLCGARTRRNRANRSASQS